ncbi:MAG: hypothetical protein AAF693_01595 [Bacteroidota bacterium]
MKLYKISTFALLVVVIVLSVFIYRHYTRQLYITDDLAQEFIKPIQKYGADHGAIFKADSGRQKLNKYVDNITSNILQNHKRSTYGYSFGLNKLDSFRSYIDSLIDYQKLDIIGVRVYRAISYDTNVNKEYFDAFMIPITSDGKNYPNIDKDHDKEIEVPEGLILNTSSPCPNMCDDEGKYTY